jgi:hypothetical protein
MQVVGEAADEREALKLARRVLPQLVLPCLEVLSAARAHHRTIR